ncbi:MAG: hypothetical protein LBR69_06925, partial [Endomicrobium sp.]|nr:hypothetical protein [Endomicrobium sp.]
KEILPLLNDLGCCASDIIQANSVIWVEGPSDRTYINKWISLISKNELKEGIDYSIMFYGGALCAHISMSDISEEETNNLINLLSINRHSAIVCDSDKNESSSELKPNVSRLKDECAKNGKTFWVTDGRTIENYVPIEYFKEVLKSDVKTDSYNEFSEIHFDKYNNNKPKYSKEIAEKITKDDVEKNEGLLAHIKDMIKMIENANPVSKELEK